ncbi:hypothetical protein CIB48_g1513 [Xylaria polymorpha]|nr:hypothetical protein CIB48_g1513 [Xylaria polymorpha]
MALGSGMLSNTDDACFCGANVKGLTIAFVAVAGGNVKEGTLNVLATTFLLFIESPKPQASVVLWTVLLDDR